MTRQKMNNIEKILVGTLCAGGLGSFVNMGVGIKGVIERNQELINYGMKNAIPGLVLATLAFTVFAAYDNYRRTKASQPSSDSYQI